MRAKTFLLVHGAWHSAMHWSAIAARLMARGHRVLALDVLGHGLNARFPGSYLRGDWTAFATEASAVRDVTLEAAAGAVAGAVGALAPAGKIVLVGHSAGGNVISRAAEMVPEHLERMVYVSAMCATKLRSAPAYAALSEAPAEGSALFIGDPAQIGAFRINPRSPDPAYVETLHAVFFGETSPETFAACAHGLTPDQPSSLWLDEIEISPARWGAVPRSFVRCLRDRALPLDVQDRMIRDADEVTPDNRFSVHDLDTDHAPFASCPSALADILARS